MKSAGICLGASNVSLVILNTDGIETQVIESRSDPHDGNAKKIIDELFKTHCLDDIERIAVTGRKFRSLVRLSSISEPEAVEEAFGFLKGKYGEIGWIVSAGGETFMAYELDQKGRIVNVYTGNKCASGTGEFFLQQIKRMDLSLSDAITADHTAPYKVAGRCSIFCKSDCTHALNKGESKSSVVAGLSKMMAEKIIELLKKSKAQNILLIGGASRNKLMVHFLKQEIPSIKVAKEAGYFEALGTALWALKNDTLYVKDIADLFAKGHSSFGFLPALSDNEDKVTFKTIQRGIPVSGDRCIIGLDVGSTTTKAVLMRTDDNTILSSIYLRTNGDPIWAARECYRSLNEQINVPVCITGLGVTGSGRQIAGLHALTKGVINEIIAHAAAAVYFDPQVDTIFEIGGQDAKYTYITNGVASDYAMNEACSAGTGSFLEEAAWESLGIDTVDIADIALKSAHPPNFNDQCAAFISSDIKNAIQEGIPIEDIIAGLVYSICQNYITRVKGSRPVGNRIFMQGGVCYNKAVPIAMAYFTGKEIIVPPEPGLMGAFGVSLEVKNRIISGLMQEQSYDLLELAKREVKQGKCFICNGGREKCDRKCKISMITIMSKQYPFGGACNKYVNEIRKIEYDVGKLDLVALRENLVFEKYAGKHKSLPNNKTIGIPKSLMVHTLYPLYSNFFSSLGFTVVLADHPDSEGVNKKGAAFCYPVELSHGFAWDLISRNTDYIFMPQVKGIFVENGASASVTCPFIQGEPYYLKTAFKEFSQKKVLSPVLDFSKGYGSVLDIFADMGQELGFTRKESIQAYDIAVKAQEACIDDMRKIGREVLMSLDNDKDKIGVVLFGRSYSAFTNDANMGVPHKFASRGHMIIPYDFLSFSDENPEKQMYWATGQTILKAAGQVKRHPGLFGCYITNFSCGPDSFLIGYFREVMGQKPSLTLELDSHSADAGLDTRIEAFIDVVDNYLHMAGDTGRDEAKIKNDLMAVTSMEKKTLHIVDSTGKAYSIKDPRVHVLIPAMGDMGARCIAAAFKYAGVNATSLPLPDEKELKSGRANSSCKECLPLLLTVGSLMNYLDSRENNDELLVYFMPETSGPCRFGQYNVLIQNLIRKKNIQNTALMSLTSENSYAGLGLKFRTRAWRAMIISDIMDDIYSAVLVLAVDRNKALETYKEVCNSIVDAIATKTWSGLKKALIKGAGILASIPRSASIEDAVKVGLVGEIYVRRDPFSRQYLVERLSGQGIIVKTAPVMEWMYYCDYIVKNSIANLKSSSQLKMKAVLERYFKYHEENGIKDIFDRSGFYQKHMIDVAKEIDNVKHLISPKLTGEAILTIGNAMTQIIDKVSGVIAIGPFGCMPNRISEAIISETINSEEHKYIKAGKLIKKGIEFNHSLPFLAIESDGNTFPQVIEARLEAFCLQVQRIHDTISRERLLEIE